MLREKRDCNPSSGTLLPFACKINTCHKSSASSFTWRNTVCLESVEKPTSLPAKKISKTFVKKSLQQRKKIENHVIFASYISPWWFARFGGHYASSVLVKRDILPQPCLRHFLLLKINKVPKFFILLNVYFVPLKLKKTQVSYLYFFINLPLWE